MNKQIPTERQEQIALHQWCKLKKLHSFAIPNGGSRHKLEAINLKKEGVTAGVSDYFVFLDGKLLVIELKRVKKLLKSGKYTTSHTNTSKEQKAFLERVNKYPYAIGRVCFGWNEAKEFIEKYI